MSIGEEKRGICRTWDRWEKREREWVEGRLDTDTHLSQNFFTLIHIFPTPYTPMPVHALLYLYHPYLLVIPHKHTPTPVMPFMYISCVPHYYYISGMLFHISFSFIPSFLFLWFQQRKNFLFRFSSRIHPARNFWKTAKISLQNYRKQLTNSPACGKIVSHSHILSNVTNRRKRVDKHGKVW